MTASAVAIAKIVHSNKLTSAGQQLSNAATLARQNSISRNALTAFILLDDPALPENRRAFALYELSPRNDGAQPKPADWKQISSWEILPSGVVAEFPDQTLSLQSFERQPATPFPPLTFRGNPVKSYQYGVFVPSGGLSQCNSAKIRLVEGPADHSGATYTHPNATGAPSNYYIVSILASTGKTRIERP